MAAAHLATRHPRSLRVCTLLRKPEAVRADVEIAYVGFDIPNEFVVGYGLDYAGSRAHPPTATYRSSARWTRRSTSTSRSRGGAAARL